MGVSSTLTYDAAAIRAAQAGARPNSLSFCGAAVYLAVLSAAIGYGLSLLAGLVIRDVSLSACAADAAAGWIVAATIGVFMIAAARRVDRVRAGETSAVLGLKQEVSLNDEGIRLSSDTGDSFERWAAFSGWTLRDDHLILIGRRGTVLPLAKAGFADGEAWEKAQELVKERLPQPSGTTSGPA